MGVAAGVVARVAACPVVIAVILVALDLGRAHAITAVIDGASGGTEATDPPVLYAV